MHKPEQIDAATYIYTLEVKRMTNDSDAVIKQMKYV